ncbi:MAG: glycosyltransferase family 39 protein [Legionellaceae bacterium]|nr:glycosyltransferase family 39 protein [Legionellaceae bacterium]
MAFIKKINLKQLSFERKIMLTCLFLLVCRVLSMSLMPLNDSTEARYAEIAREMAETGQWITPMLDYVTPFLGKPPLSFWLTAGSMKLFGLGEGIARLSSLVLSMLTLICVGLVYHKASHTKAWIAVLALASSVFFFIDAGAVMTDPALVFSTTLAMVAFWQVMTKKRARDSHLYFIALGIGLLAKGPVALVLTVGSVLLWVAFQNKWREMFQNIRWVSGILITTAIALPWYILAEIHNPGFLNYFIIGEHFGRYLQSSWQGDKYGYVHAVPQGMIWLYALAGTFPWTPVAIHGLVSNRVSLMPKKIYTYLKQSAWISYLVAFILFPLIFFSLSKNIIYTYAFPALPPLALLFTELMTKQLKQEPRLQKTWLILSASIGIIFLGVTWCFFAHPEWVSKSQKEVVRAWESRKNPSSQKLYYWSQKPAPYSAWFYSRGNVASIADALDFCGLLNQPEKIYVVVNIREAFRFPACADAKLKAMQTFSVGKKSNYILYST